MTYKRKIFLFKMLNIEITKAKFNKTQVVCNTIEIFLDKTQ